MPAVHSRRLGLSASLLLLGASMLLLDGQAGVAAQAVVCDGTATLIQAGMEGITSATFNDRTPLALGGPNRIRNGDFSFNITGQDMNDPNTARGPLPQETQSFQPLYSEILDWIGTGGGPFSYPMWGGKTATQYSTGWYPVAQDAGASLSSVYMGNAFSQYNGTRPTFDANGYGIATDPDFYCYSAYGAIYGGRIPVNITQVVSGLVPGEKYRLSFFQGGEDAGKGASSGFAATGVAALDVSGYERVYFLVSGVSAEYRFIDFVAKASSHVLSFLNWGHVEILGPPNTFPANSPTELAFDDVVLVQCPSSTCTPTKAATAWTSPSRKVAPHKIFTYNARLASTKQPLGAASLQAASATKGQALINATFTMTVPADVNVLSWSSFPKLTTQPVFNSATRVLTWTLGSAVVKPGRSAKLSFKMQPTACTTPDALALNGRFDFIDATGAKTVGACLKKPVYVWRKGCAAIPKPVHMGHGGKNKTNVKF